MVLLLVALSYLGIANAAVTGSGDVPTTDDAAAMSWYGYFVQSFYHMSVVPLLLLTIGFALAARPSTREEVKPEFRSFQIAYLSVWMICVAADWLQGPYVYALYAAYGFQRHEIAQLFVAGFGASLAFGCVVGSVADRFGRKMSCLAYCGFYIVSCCTKHVNSYWVLMFGRITGGIATSMLFSCFECWLVSEHFSRNFNSGLLGYMFGLMFTSMYLVAILSGLSAQFVADSFAFGPISEGSSIYAGGNCAPFDLSICCLIIGIVLILSLWTENYGSRSADDSSSAVENFKAACRLLFVDKNMILLCFVVSCFEGSMYAFVFNWTPALDSKTVPPPHGLIFALFMMSCMIGASITTIIGDRVKVISRLMATFLLAIVAFCCLSYVAGSTPSLQLSFFGFLVFEFCCGLYFPSVGVLKSEVVPEHIRGTMYNIYRVPLNMVVVGLLLSDISMFQCFVFCASLLTISLFSIIGIANNRQKSKTDEDCPLTKAC
jgi:MFS family permease